jgi:hypothetical protein
MPSSEVYYLVQLDSLFYCVGDFGAAKSSREYAIIWFTSIVVYHYVCYVSDMVGVDE